MAELRTEIDVMEMPGDVQRVMRQFNVRGNRIELYAAPAIDMPYLKKTKDTRYVMVTISPAPDGHTETKTARHVGRFTLLDVPKRAAEGDDPHAYQAWIDQPRTMIHEPGLIYLHLLENRSDGAKSSQVMACALSMGPSVLRELLNRDKYPRATIETLEATKDGRRSKKEPK